MSVSLISSSLVLLTILGQAIIVAGIIYYFISRKSGKSIVKDFLGAHGLILAFLVASVAMLGSLFYSEIAQYAVCRLCWYHRFLCTRRQYYSAWRPGGRIKISRLYHFYKNLFLRRHTDEFGRHQPVIVFSNFFGGKFYQARHHGE